MGASFAFILESLISPPASPILAILGGVWLARKHPRVGALIGALGLAALVLCSMPIVAYGLVHSLESRYPTLSSSPENARAIVVMGGGRQRNRPDFNSDSANSYALERLRYAAYLHRQTSLPVVIAAGSITYDGKREAEVMQQVMQDEFGVPVQWLEKSSQNTYQNAANLATLLRRQRIEDVIVVTHAWHMPRTLWVFERVGINAIPAPTALNRENPIDTGFAAFIPQANAMMMTRVVTHEWLGLWWYQYVY